MNLKVEKGERAESEQEVKRRGSRSHPPRNADETALIVLHIKGHLNGCTLFTNGTYNKIRNKKSTKKKQQLQKLQRK